MKEALTARQTGELTISPNLNRLNQRSVFMPEPVMDVSAVTRADIKEGALRRATGEERTRQGEENKPAAVLAKGIKENRDPNDPEASLEQIAVQGETERFGLGQERVAIDTKKGREFVEKSFVGKYKGERKGVVREGEEKNQYESVVKEKGRLESAIKDYDNLEATDKTHIRQQVKGLLESMPAGKALLDSLPEADVDSYLDGLVTQSSAELGEVYGEIYGAEPAANNIDAAQAKLNKLKEALKSKTEELKSLKKTEGVDVSAGQGGALAAGETGKKGEIKLAIPKTREDLASLEQELRESGEDIQLWSSKLVPGREDVGGFKDRLDQAVSKRDALRDAIKQGRQSLAQDSQAGETAETPEQKILRLKREIYVLPSEIGQAQADLDLAKLSRKEGLEDLVQRSKDAVPEAVAKHLDAVMEQAEQEIRGEIGVMKEKATTEKEKAALNAIEKAISTRYGLKEVVTRRDGSIKKVREVYDRTNLYGDAKLLVEDGEDVYMAAIVKGIDPKTLTQEQREELKSTAKETLSAIKPEDLVKLKTAAKGKLITTLASADGKLPSGMENYLMDTPDGQKMIDEAAAKHKEMFKGIKGRVSEYFRTMDRKKALKLLLFMFLPLLVTIPLMATGKFNPFSSGN